MPPPRLSYFSFLRSGGPILICYSGEGGRVPFCYEKGGGGGKEEFTAVLSPLPPLCHKRNALLAQALPAKEEREEGKKLIIYGARRRPHIREILVCRLRAESEEAREGFFFREGKDPPA